MHPISDVNININKFNDIGNIILMVVTQQQKLTQKTLKEFSWIENIEREKKNDENNNKNVKSRQEIEIKTEVKCKHIEGKEKSLKWLAVDSYGVVTGDPPSLSGGGKGNGDGGGSFTSCPLQ